MRVLKFGGSSLAKPDRVRDVCEIVARANAAGPVCVVVSAFGGVTDSLLGTARSAERREDTYPARLEGLERRHLAAASQLASRQEAPELEQRIERDFRNLGELVHGIHILREATPRTLDSILSVGERLSAAIVAAALRAHGVDTEDCDARRLVVTDAEFGNARVQEETTRMRIRRHFADARALQVVTGFIAATEDDETTTLGRGGSDYTAALVGAALEAEAVELWTDVDGVLSADPRLVREAVPTEHLSYDELMELSHFGAKVVHPPSVHPLRHRSIPLRIKNTFRPDAVGTLVTDGARPEPAPAGASPVRGVASISAVTLIRLEGDGMVGVPGIAMRLFGALARRGVSVIMISQASSEHSICFAVAPEAGAIATRSLEEEFAVERRAGLIDELVIEEDQSIVAAVGAGMRERCGVAGRLFGVLGRHGVNVRAVAQGSSELNISLVVDGDDEALAVNAIHDTFFLAGSRRVEVGLCGVGRVGSALLEQLADRAAALERDKGIRLRLTGVADSKGAVLDLEGIDPGSALARIAEEPGREPLDALVDRLASDRGALRVFVDCTASASVAACYERLLNAGVPVVTANKLRFAGPLVDWHRLRAAGPGRLYHETTVGAALPVLGTLRDLVATGDRLRRIDGILSGTLGFLLNEVAEGAGFADSVRRAHEGGYTEPDPREDLGGRDVARKLLILARLAGRELEPDAVAVEPLLPSGWNDLDPDEFWKRLPQLDAALGARVAAAATEGKRLAYLATLGEEGARVALEPVGPDHPCAGARGTDNLIAFTTDRYRDAPLVVRGPGAGPALTAAGVFADLLRAIEQGEGGLE